MGCAASSDVKQVTGAPPTTTSTTSSTTPDMGDSTPFFFDSDGAEGASLSRGAGTVLGGFGVSTASDDRRAAKEALESAASRLAQSAGASLAPSPTIAFVSCTSSRDSEKVRQELVRAMPEALLHGVTSSIALLGPAGSVGNAVGCLLLEGPEGGFALGWDEDGNAAEAAAWLRDQMPKPQAVILGAAPGAEEEALAALAATFPGVPVYGGTASDDENAGKWSVISHLGSSSTGISLVGIGDNVGFGASLLAPYSPTTTTGKVTKVEPGKGSVSGVSRGRGVLEIDGAPAALFIKGVDPRPPPLGIRTVSGDYAPVHVAAVEASTGRVDLMSSVAEGDELCILDGADGASTGFAAALGDGFEAALSAGGISQPTAAILVCDAGAMLASGHSRDVGLTGILRERVGELPLLGLNAFGQQGRLGASDTNAQLNLSQVFLVFGEQAPILGVDSEPDVTTPLPPPRLDAFTGDGAPAEAPPPLHCPELAAEAAVEGSQAEAAPPGPSPTPDLDQVVDEDEARQRSENVPEAKLAASSVSRPFCPASCCFEANRQPSHDICTDHLQYR